MWNKPPLMTSAFLVFALSVACGVRAQVPIKIYNTGVDNNNQLLPPLAPTRITP